MTITFAPDVLMVDKLVARRTLLQLNRLSLFPRVAMGDFEPAGTWEVGQTVKFNRPRITEAVEYDPRTGNGLTLTQPGYISGELKLESLITNGFPVYGPDYQVDRYILDYSNQLSQSIGVKFDASLYNKFLTPTHASSGPVAYAANTPLACVASEDSNGLLTDFNRFLLVNMGTVFDRNNVPPAGRYGMISSTAKGAYIGEAIPVDAGYQEAMGGGTNLLINGMPIGQFTQRHGFNVGGSNVVLSQVAVPDLDSASGNSPSLAIAAADLDTSNGGNPMFYQDDYVAAPSLGAVRLTLTTTGNLVNVAVGQFARLGPTNGPAKAYGVILRVDLANKYVWVVPFSLKGALVSAAQISTANDKFSIPDIGSINIAMHSDALVYATRMMRPPSQGSGAIATTQVDPNSNVAMQVWRGSYDITRFREGMVSTLLSGSKITDYRMCGFMLSL